MDKLVFATNNAHKLDEVRAILGSDVEVLSLNDIGCNADIPETADTLEGNALLKARFVASRYGVDCFADDTGLEVTALGGAPGVYSARFAGPACDSAENVRKLLGLLHDADDRSARFRTVVALIRGGEEHCFEGTVGGTIARTPAGCGGFGYDPVFVPEGHDRTFAELPPAEKNRISHRARAVAKLADFLRGKEQEARSKR